MNNLKPSQIAILAGGAVTLLFSFFAFVSFDGFGDDVTYSAWSFDANLFPLATWPAIFGAIVAGGAAASIFGNVKLPNDVLGFTWNQVCFILSFAALTVMIGFMFFNENKGIGFWFMLLGTLAYSAGAVMELLGIEPGGDASARPGNDGGGTGTQPPTPF